MSPRYGKSAGTISSLACFVKANLITVDGNNFLDSTLSPPDANTVVNFVDGTRTTSVGYQNFCSATNTAITLPYPQLPTLHNPNVTASSTVDITVSVDGATSAVSSADQFAYVVPTPMPCSRLANDATYSPQPVKCVSSTYEDAGSISVQRDAGMSVPLPNGKDLWIYDDSTEYPSTTTGLDHPPLNKGFVGDSTGTLGTASNAGPKNMCEVRSSAIAAITAPDCSSSSDQPKVFLPEPSSTPQCDYKDNSQLRAANWPSDAVSEPENPWMILITFGSECIDSSSGSPNFTALGQGIVEYDTNPSSLDPHSNSFVTLDGANNTGFLPTLSAPDVDNSENNTNNTVTAGGLVPFFSDGKLWLLSSACATTLSFGICPAHDGSPTGPNDGISVVAYVDAYTPGSGQSQLSTAVHDPSHYSYLEPTTDGSGVVVPCNPALPNGDANCGQDAFNNEVSNRLGVIPGFDGNLWSGADASGVTTLVASTDLTGDYQIYQSQSPPDLTNGEQKWSWSWQASPIVEGRLPGCAGVVGSFSDFGWCYAFYLHPEDSSSGALRLSYYQPGAGAWGHVVQTSIDLPKAPFENLDTATFTAGDNNCFTVQTDPGWKLSFDQAQSTLPNNVSVETDKNCSGRAAATNAIVNGTPANDTTRGTYQLVFHATNGAAQSTMTVTMAVVQNPTFSDPGSCTATDGPDNPLPSTGAIDLTAGGIVKVHTDVAVGCPVSGAEAAQPSQLAYSDRVAPVLSVSGTQPSGVTFTDDGMGGGTFSAAFTVAAGRYLITLTALDPMNDEAVVQPIWLNVEA